ncbi:hypothetical protein M7I_6903 [Glarea lozoyensis 74030]|uniref:Uncharacterized protein n=1 Tax=Glarea lozoyensis (strain ATCC 74030 / MF5533) TaxID=1104152 RepID=H0EVU6_GLAL7|nr:hypothetical protein M7I_6903 [Glarea lozoyensis 74030]
MIRQKLKIWDGVTQLKMHLCHCLTGAPEKYHGEAVENEAANFVNGFTSIAISSAAGKHPQGDPHAGEEGASTPFPKDKPRMKLAGCLAPVLLISMFTSSYMFYKMNGFFIGFGFFADPIIWRGLTYLNEKYPDWQKLLELRNTLLKGVGCLRVDTITLLRIGEVNKAPLPPPPYSGPPPPHDAHETAGQNLEHLGVPDDEIAAAINPDPTTPAEVHPPKKKAGRRIVAALKSATKGSVETILGTDRLKAAAGSGHAKNRLGVLTNGLQREAGPVAFPCRFKGRKGHAYITTTATSPALSWTTALDDRDPVFSVAIQDIMEIKKVGGLGWKTKLVVGWATDREIADGLVVVDKVGEKKHLTAIALREELFNRLIALGNQMWEAW